MPLINNIHEARKSMALQIQQLDLKQKPDIFRIEIKIKPIDALSWLWAQKAPVKIYGANQDNTAAIAGIGEALSVKGNKDVERVFKELRCYLSGEYPYLQWYGGFCFDKSYLDASWQGFGAYRFTIPRFELARDGKKMIFVCNLMGRMGEKQRKVILRELALLKFDCTLPNAKISLKSRRDSPSLKDWDKNVAAVTAAINKGSMAKVVLARKTILFFDKALNAVDILKRLIQVTPNSYHFLFQFGSSVFLGASPERLYKRQGRHIVSEAIAGTMARGKSQAEDIWVKKQLKASLKNNHEHALVVKAIDKSLGGLCDDLRHAAQPGLISLGNGHHLTTPFSGRLKQGVLDERILKSLHPTPAVAGVSSVGAIKAIAKMEPFSRGWYAGPLGYVGLDWAEFVVGIRSGLVKGKQLSVFAGAGIVRGSESTSEWEEIENKISNFMRVCK